jgi:anti-repressor protein
MQIFENAEFGQVRTVVIDNEPWFVGKDVADILGYSNSRKAIADHVDEEDKGVTICDTLGGKQEMTVINESGLYALVFGSKLPSAKRFKHWVTSEVLPAIRKTGQYKAPATPEEQMAQGLLAAQKLLAEKNQQIEEMKPKAIFADAVSASKTSILIGDLAKLIRQNGVDVGQKRLFGWLREHGWLMKGGASKNMPTQRGMEMGLFEVKEGSYVNGDGVNVTTKTTKVTGKGQVYFVNRFLNKEAG